jgi:hypothetical protein
MLPFGKIDAAVNKFVVFEVPIQLFNVEVALT